MREVIQRRYFQGNTDPSQGFTFDENWVICKTLVSESANPGPAVIGETLRRGGKFGNAAEG